SERYRCRRRSARGWRIRRRTWRAASRHSTACTDVRNEFGRSRLFQRREILRDHLRGWPCGLGSPSCRSRWPLQAYPPLRRRRAASKVPSLAVLLDTTPLITECSAPPLAASSAATMPRSGRGRSRRPTERARVSFDPATELEAAGVVGSPAGLPRELRGLRALAVQTGSSGVRIRSRNTALAKRSV